MRTIAPILFVAALGTAALIWGLSGFGAVYGVNDPVSGLESGDALEDQANDSAVSNQGQFNGSADNTDGSDNIVGIVISGISAVVQFATLVAFLPFELQRLGFPFYFAFPLGVLTQAIVGVGVVQFASNRVFR
jgi:hypothetical protein